MTLGNFHDYPVGVHAGAWRRELQMKIAVVVFDLYSPEITSQRVGLAFPRVNWSVRSFGNGWGIRPQEYFLDRRLIHMDVLNARGAMLHIGSTLTIYGGRWRARYVGSGDASRGQDERSSTY